ncbi:MAG TPA: hypothetical protein VFC19_07800 [Candidatus Limnocylindrales bacterium]|nr:hypothetical protein [Candidatus Limnocylindrales bacterium]
MGSPTVFSKLEFTSVLVVSIVAGMVLGGLVGTARRAAGVRFGYTIASRGTDVSRAQRTTRSSSDRVSGGGGDRAPFPGWAGAGLDRASLGSGQWVNLSAAATYLAPTAMLPLAALPSGSPLVQAPQPPVQGPHPPVSLLAPQSPAYLLAAPLSPAIPLSPAGPPGSPEAWQSGGSPLVELQPVAFLPGVYQATTYRLDVTEQTGADQAGGPIRPLWRLGNALFSAARGTTARAFTPPAGSPPSLSPPAVPPTHNPDADARPGRHRASRSKRMRRTSNTGSGDARMGTK